MYKCSEVPVLIQHLFWHIQSPSNRISRAVFVWKLKRVSHYSESSLSRIWNRHKARFFINFDYKMSEEYNKFDLYILCVTKFLTSSLAVFEAAIRVKSMYIIKSWLKPEKEKIWKSNLHLKMVQKWNSQLAKAQIPLGSTGLDTFDVSSPCILAVSS